MNMTQAWPLVAITVAVIGVLLRQMSLQRSELITRIDGVEAKLDARFDGLRNELLATLQPMARQLDRLDQDVRDHLKSHSGGG